VLNKNTDRKKILKSFIVGLALITKKVFTDKFKPYGSISFIFSENDKLNFDGKEIQFEKGTVLIITPELREKWSVNLENKNILFLYEENYLPFIFTTCKNRVKYMEQIEKCLKKIESSDFINCIQKNNFTNLKLLGQGSYGNVFQTSYCSKTFAVKLSKIKPESLKAPYDTSYSCWHEIYYLEKIFKPLIKKNVCPNIPLLYNHFLCDKCDIEIDDTKLQTPCVVLTLEIAWGNLKKYLKKKRNVQELRSILFQIMAGLHTIQYYAQLMNFDIKKENTLIYETVKGGYWKYVIKGETYYVPNYGHLAVLNDFGISRTMSPDHLIFKNPEEKSFRLGSRYAIIKDKKFIPFNTFDEKNDKGEIKPSEKIKWQDGQVSQGASFRLNKKDKKIMSLNVEIKDELREYLNSLKIKENTIDFFKYPEIIPPFEFYNDLQDAIRMFVGGKRTTQRGDHRTANVSKKFIDSLTDYLGGGDSLKNNFFSTDPSQVLASYFIESYFQDYKILPVGEKIIDTYIISI
jgi:serine/threonine protein kinase